MKYYIIITVVILLSIFLSVFALTLDDYTISSTGLNSSFIVTDPIILAGFETNSSYIYFNKINYSNSNANASYELTLNYTYADTQYNTMFLPYVKNNIENYTIISQIGYLENLTFKLYGAACNNAVGFLLHPNKTIEQIQSFSCVNNNYTFDIDYLSMGDSYIFFYNGSINISMFDVRQGVPFEIEPSFNVFLNLSDLAANGRLEFLSNYSNGTYAILRHGQLNDYKAYFPQSCIKSPIEFKMVADANFTFGPLLPSSEASYAQCYNGTDWINFGKTNLHTGAYSYAYAFSTIWNYNESLNSWYNRQNGNSLTPAGEIAALDYANLKKVTVYYEPEKILNFTIIKNSVNYTTTNGTIQIPASGNIDFLTVSDYKGGYHNLSIINLSIANEYFGLMNKLYRSDNFTFYNYSTYGDLNYTRSLRYAYNLTCPDFLTTSLDIYINGTYNRSDTLNCINDSKTYYGSFKAGHEGDYNINLKFNTSYLPDINNNETGNFSFISDLNNPVANISFNISNGFVIANTNVTLQCNDTIYPNITFNMSLNNNLLFYGNKSANTSQTNLTLSQSGLNTAFGTCADPFGQQNSTYEDIVYSAVLALIDERENVPFNVNNLTSVRVYYDDNSTYYDFKAAGKSSVNFTTVDQDKLRFELVYLGDVIITRYIDVSLFVNQTVRVCANKEGITHFEQLTLSAVQEPVRLLSIFANCYIAADYTRFIYQNSYMLKSFSIDNQYRLYTFNDDEEEVLLVGLDGSIASYYNVDTIKATQTPYNFNILGDSLTFQKSADTTIRIDYDNIKEDNTALTLDIINMETQATIMSYNSFTNPNDFTVYFDYSTISNITNATVFQAKITRTTATGVQEPSKRYFDTNAKSGYIATLFALILSLFLVLFGLTFVKASSTFGWFGLLIMIVAIAVLTFAVQTWYLILLQMIYVIMLIYILITISKDNTLGIN